MEAILTYNAKVDSKKRITLRKTNYEYYEIKEFEDGTIVLEPKVLVSPFQVSENTLKMMDKSIDNLKKGKVSKEIKFK